eukprot:g18246.t1
MGEVLNEYFSSVFIVKKDMKTWELVEVSGDILGTVHITVQEVLDVLNFLVLTRYIQESCKRLEKKLRGPWLIYLHHREPR